MPIDELPIPPATCDFVKIEIPYMSDDITMKIVISFVFVIIFQICFSDYYQVERFYNTFYQLSNSPNGRYRVY